MKAEKIKIYAVHCYEGERDIGLPTYFCSSQGRAECTASKSGQWGNDASIQERHAIRMDDEVFLLDERFGDPIDLDGKLAAVEADARARALSKLTPAERKLLGL